TVAGEKRAVWPDGGTGMMGSGTGGGTATATGSGAGSGTGGPSSDDARPDIPNIPVPNPNKCGDGLIEPGEDCDDANRAPGDGCSAICQAECFESCGWCGGTGPCGGPSCGDFRLESGETCEDGNSDSGDGCSSACAIEPG